MSFTTQDIRLGETKAHVWSGGSGVPLLMMHGAGPGTSAAANFGKVRDPLAARYHLYATDMIGFGLSGRKTEAPYFDYPLWLQQMQAVLDLIPDGPVFLLGHSISATFAMRLAARNPRVKKVLLTCPMGQALAPNPHRERLWSFPWSRDDLRKSLEVLFSDHNLITDELLDSRMAVLSEPGYGEYFEKMFGGDKQALVEPTILEREELEAVTCPIAIIHGRSDLAFPIEETAYPMSEILRQADIHALSRCGHGPAFERTETFLKITFDFFG